MSWVTFIWSLTAGVCFTLSTINLIVWTRDRQAVTNLLFSISAAAATVLAVLELQLMRSQTPIDYATTLRWMHVPVSILVITFVWFIKNYLGTGRAWLAWSITGLRTLIVLLNFSPLPNATFQEIQALEETVFLGETLSVPVGEVNPFRILTKLSVVLLLVFVIDAAFAAWKLGSKRQALVIGASAPITVVLASFFSDLMVRGVLPGPLTTLVFLIVVLAMAFELSVGLLNARQLNERLRQSEERMRMAARAAEIGFWEWDIERDTVWVDERGAETLGTSEPSPLSQEDYLTRIHPEDRKRVRQALDEAVHHHGEFEAEFRISAPDGVDRWVYALGQVLPSKQGEPVYMRGISLDTTERRRAETELLKHRNALVRNQRILSMGQLSAALTHELNQPLGAILRNAEAGEMIVDHASPDLAELREIFTDLQSDGRRAAAVIDRMGALLRHRKLIREPTSVRNIVDSVVSLLEADARARNVVLEIEIDSDLPWIIVDRVHLQQVLLNLLLNGMDALDARPRDSRRLRISATRSEDGRVEMAVRDNGPGIDQEQFARLFEPFITSKEHGTGIGLALSQTIIEAHDGWIWAENNGEAGACFRFSLPAAPPATPA